MRVLVTGGAGFIGSCLCEELVKRGCEVSILDNFSSGSRSNVQHLLDAGSHRVRLFVGDCTKSDDLARALKGVDVVFHFAANPEVRLELSDPETCFRQNVYATHVVLEAVRNSRVKKIVFASTSTVYGDARVVPTPEDYAPLEPISVYGASKLASEALITAYAHSYGFAALILRFANVVGSRSGHGVIFDFVRKLRENPRELEILGDEKQSKSYLHVEDGVDAVFLALRHFLSEKKVLEVYNVGSLDKVDVKRIAEIVSEEMELRDLEFRFTGGVDGGRGWRGDVKNMLLSVDKLLNLGWRPKLDSEEAVRLSCRDLLRSIGGACVSV